MKLQFDILFIDNFNSCVAINIYEKCLKFAIVKLKFKKKEKKQTDLKNYLND